VKRNDFLKKTFLTTAGLSLTSTFSFRNKSLKAGSKNTKPNIIIIFTDDQGYQDLGCYGSPDINTPNIDNMAKNGKRFTDFYVASSVCSPSRAALLTGCYPARVGINGVFFPNREKTGLNPKETTIAKMLKKIDYKTACIGKWHLGDQVEFLPTKHGFDSYYGIPYSNDMFPSNNMKYSKKALFREGVTLEVLTEILKTSSKPKEYKSKVPLMRGEECIEFPADQSTITKRYTDEAIKVINENKNNPFFIYLAHTMPHVPLYTSKDFTGKSKRGTYGDVIEELDFNVGRILDHLKKLKIEENTLVVYTSDNGPWLIQKEDGGSAFPLRDGKMSSFEGGQRVPCVMSWPGTIPAGVDTSEIASTIDLLPTIAKITGAPLPANKLDGMDISKLLKGDKNEKSPRDHFYFGKSRLGGIRVGDWKYYGKRSLRDWNSKKKKLTPYGESLFNLKEDLSEKNNVIDKYPEKTKELKERLAKFVAELEKEKRPAGYAGPVHIEYNEPKNKKKKKRKKK
jgi:arylsulfatase A